jgi:putative phosphoribosyl transferase
MQFHDRRQAGIELARQVAATIRDPDAVVLALPRGGVPVALEVAQALGVPLDCMVVRKIGVPEHRELAIGAIASEGLEVLDHDLIGALGLSREEVDDVRAIELAEVERRRDLYRGNRPPLSVSGKTIVLVDDGMATGSTMLAAIQALRTLNPRRIAVAVPVSSSQAARLVREKADDLICLSIPPWFHAVSQWYEEFPQVSDETVRQMLGAQA